MNVSLTDDLSRFVAEQLQAGYNNESEVIPDGLRLLRARNDKLRQLRAAVEAGILDVEAHGTKALTDDLLHDVADRARSRVARRPAKSGR
jgi:putative addiction module CopG family antidote